MVTETTQHYQHGNEREVKQYDKTVLSMKGGKIKRLRLEYLDTTAALTEWEVCE